MKTRKLLSFVLCFVMALSINGVAFAAVSPTEPVTDPKVSEKIVPSTTDNGSFSGIKEATEAEKEKWADIEKPDVTTKDSSVAPLASWESLSPFTYYGQEKNYSCGPATVRMALKYLTGDTYTESEIRTGCNTTTSGTSLSDMADYINDEQDENYYIVKYGSTQTTMKNNLYSGIHTFGAPPVVGLEESTSDGWPYDLPGHGIAVYGAMSDKSEFALCDPWAGYNGDDSNRWYNKTDDDLFDAYDALGAGYMY